MGIAGAQPVGMVDEDRVSKAGVHAVDTSKPDVSIGRRSHVLVVEGEVPTVVAVVVKVVAAIRRDRIAAGEPWVDAVGGKRDRTVVLADPAVRGVVGIAVIEDRGWRVVV